MGLFDRTLEDASLAAEAIHTSHSAVPLTTEDYDERKKGSFIARRIEGFRAQLRRGAPVTSGPIETLVSSLICFHKRWTSSDFVVNYLSPRFLMLLRHNQRKLMVSMIVRRLYV